MVVHLRHLVWLAPLTVVAVTAAGLFFWDDAPAPAPSPLARKASSFGTLTTDSHPLSAVDSRRESAGRSREKVLDRRFFRALAAHSPASALRLAARLERAADRRAAWMGIQKTLGPPLSVFVAFANDAVAVAALRQLLPAAQRDLVISQGVTALAARDPRLAADWLGAVSNPDLQRNALFEIGRRWAWQDTESALNWAGALSSPADRGNARTAIQSVAPVGIGVAVGRDDASPYPRALQIIAGSPVGRTGLVRPGDRIVGVTGTNSQWIDTAGQNVERVARLIRGEPGQAVQLRLLPAGASDPADARVVTVVREQILFRQN